MSTEKASMSAPVHAVVRLPVEQVTWNDDSTMTLVVRGHVEPVQNGDHVLYERRGTNVTGDLLDTIKAMLVACGGSVDDAELEKQCKAAGTNPSDFIAAVGGRLLSLIDEWHTGGRYGYSLPVIPVELIWDIERIQRGEEVQTKEVTRAYSALEEDKPLMPPWHKE